jgi:hypothetical protein
MICGFMADMDWPDRVVGAIHKHWPLKAPASAQIEWRPKWDTGKLRYLKAVSHLSQAFALAVPHDSALEIPDEVGFFRKSGRCWPRASAQAVKSHQKNWMRRCGRSYRAPSLPTR